jgi:hypothetical protein
MFQIKEVWPKRTTSQGGLTDDIATLPGQTVQRSFPTSG